MATDIQTFFATTKVSTIPIRREEVVTFTTDTPLAEGFEALVSNRIQAAPVYSDDEGKYIGFLDIRDLVSFIVHIGAPPDPRDRFVADIAAAADEQGVTLAYLARRNKFASVSPDASLADVATILRTGYKRVAVLDGDQVTNVLSQTSLVDVMHQHVDLIPDAIRNGEVDTTLPKCLMSVYTVPNTATVLGTFKLLDDKKITGVAVVNGQGQIDEVVTGKDLKMYIKEPSIEKLTRNVVEMVGELRSESQRPTETMYVARNAPVEEILRKLVRTRFHRVYLVDNVDDPRPVGIVSLSNILSFAV